MSAAAFLRAQESKPGAIDALFPEFLDSELFAEIIGGWKHDSPNFRWSLIMLVSDLAGISFGLVDPEAAKRGLQRQEAQEMLKEAASLLSVDRDFFVHQIPYGPSFNGERFEGVVGAPRVGYTDEELAGLLGKRGKRSASPDPLITRRLAKWVHPDHPQRAALIVRLAAVAGVELKRQNVTRTLAGSG